MTYLVASIVPKTWHQDAPSVWYRMHDYSLEDMVLNAAPYILHHVFYATGGTNSRTR